MSDARTYPHGVPCWVDTQQPDPEAAAHFYAELFGWTFHDAVPAEAPGSYLIATLGGSDVAAVASASDQPTAWNTYIAVDDADAAALVVDRHGGTVISAPRDAGLGGRMAVCTDPDGATFRLWQADGRLGAQLVNAAGTWNFSDLHSEDPVAGVAFYALS
ncbi:MAG: VOC family protein [Solirubrobacteraceae bacterium]